jgi:glycosyltransferase involved in cell wall biosynthesis
MTPASTPSGARPRIGFLTERMLLGFGVDLVIHKTAEGLAARGYDITVFASVSDGTFEGGPYRIVRLGIPASPIFPYTEWQALKKLPVLRDAAVDLFVIETFPLFVLGPFLRRPFMVEEYGVCSTVGIPWWLRAEFLYMRLAQNCVYFPFARRIVSISAFLRNALPFYLRGRTRVIHPGTDHYAVDGEPGAARAAVRERFGVGKDEVLLLYVGRINPRRQPYKGTAELVECFTRLRAAGAPARLLVVGNGGPEDEAWLAGQGIQCWRSAPLDAMGAIYSAADVYVTASRWEGFNMPLVEAQQFGKPAVALRVGAHPEVVRDGETGFLVDDMAAFEAAVRRLVEDAEARGRMGEQARVFSARFSWESAVEAYDRVLQEAVGETRWTR